MIESKLLEYKELRNSLSDKSRLKRGKVYLPKFFLEHGSYYELLGVIKEVKPVVEINFHDKFIGDFNQAVKELEDCYGLKYKLGDYKFLIDSFNDSSSVAKIDDSREGLMSASISFDKGKAEKSEELFLEKSKSGISSNENSHEFAKLMGYPECCVEFTKKLKGGKVSREDREKNLLWSKIDIRAYMESKKFSRLLNVFTINPLIPHSPCHLNCSESKKYAQEMLDVFRGEDERFEGVINYFLDLSAIYWHYSEKFLLEGEKNGNTFHYTDFLEFSYSNKKFYGGAEEEFNKKMKKTKKLLKKGDTIVMKDDHFQIKNSKEVLGKIEKEYKNACILV